MIPYMNKEKAELKHEIYQKIDAFLDSWSKKRRSKKLQKKIEEQQRAIQENFTQMSSWAIVEYYKERLLVNNENPDGSFLYDWSIPNDVDGTQNGWYKFSKIPHTNRYKLSLSNKEIWLFEQNRDKVRNIISSEDIKRIVDMWWWDGEKTHTIFKKIGTYILRNKILTTKEISPYLVQQYKNNRQTWKNTDWIHCDVASILEGFMQNNDIKAQKDGRTFMFLWWSIGNFDDEQIQKILLGMSSDRVKWSRDIMMTLFLAPEEDDQDSINELLACYGDPNTNNPYNDKTTNEAISDRVLSWLHHYLWEESKDALEFAVTYEKQWEKWWRILVWAKVTKPLQVRVWNEVITKQTWDYIWAIQSRRFTKKHFKDLVENIWYTLESLDNNKTVWLAFIKTKSSNPENKTHEQVQKEAWNKKVRNYGTLTMWVATAVSMATSSIKDNFFQKEREKNLKEILDNQLVNKDFTRWYLNNNTSEERYSQFLNMVDHYYKNLFSRYDLDEYSTTKQNYAKELLIQRLLNKDESIISVYITHLQWQGGIYNMNDKISELIASFVSENSYLLTANNISLRIHKSLEKYEDIFKNTLDEKNDTMKVKQFSMNVKNGYSAKLERSWYKWLWVYTTRTWIEYIYGIYTVSNKEYIVWIPSSGADHSKKEELDIVTDWYWLPKDNSDDYGNLTIEYWKEIAADYFKKPYVYTLSEKIEKTLWTEEPKIRVKKWDIISRTTYMIKDWYDFSRLVTSKKKEDILAYTHTFCDYLYEDSTNEKYNKRKTLNNILEIIDTVYFAKDMWWKLWSRRVDNLWWEIFHALCKDTSWIDLSKRSNIPHWLDLNSYILKPLFEYEVVWFKNMPTSYPHILPIEDSSKFGGSEFYKKRMPDDILYEPSETGSIYNYVDSKWKRYSVKFYKGNVYARLLSNDIKDEVGKYANMILQQCINQNIWPWGKDLDNRWSDGYVPDYIQNSRTMFKDHINQRLYSYNTEFGNMVYTDFKERIKDVKNMQVEAAERHSGWVK